MFELYIFYLQCFKSNKEYITHSSSSLNFLVVLTSFLPDGGLGRSGFGSPYQTSRTLKPAGNPFFSISSKGLNYSMFAVKSSWV